MQRLRTSVNAPAAATYEKVVLSSQQADGLIQLFVNEPTYLGRSPAANFDFSLAKCIQRLRIGHHLILFDYNTADPMEALVKGKAHGLVFKQRGRRVRVPYSEIAGLSLGDQTSTFKTFTQLYGNLEVFGLKPMCCMTVHTAKNSYSIGSINVLHVYDLYLVLSWYASANQAPGTVFPLTKGQLTVYVVRRKLQDMAAERYISVKELLMVSTT